MNINKKRGKGGLNEIVNAMGIQERDSASTQRIREGFMENGEDYFPRYSHTLGDLKQQTILAQFLRLEPEFKVSAGPCSL